MIVRHLAQVRLREQCRVHLVSSNVSTSWSAESQGRFCHVDARIRRAELLCPENSTTREEARLWSQGLHLVPHHTSLVRSALKCCSCDQWASWIGPGPALGRCSADDFRLEQSSDQRAVLICRLVLRQHHYPGA